MSEDKQDLRYQLDAPMRKAREETEAPIIDGWGNKLLDIVGTFLSLFVPPPRTFERDAPTGEPPMRRLTNSTGPR